jgi:hypothetical protein
MATLTLHSVNENEHFLINTDHIKSIQKSISGGSTIKFRVLQGKAEQNEITVIEAPEFILNEMNNLLICNLVK